MLGYVKHFKTTSAQKKTLRKGNTAKMYHKQLSIILSSLIESKETLKDVAIQFENKNIQYYDITCPVLYIISDTEGADKICGRYACHNLGKVYRHCRMCDVNSDNLDNHNYNINYLRFTDMDLIARNTTNEERTQYSQHDISNALREVNFGSQQ